MTQQEIESAFTLKIEEEYFTGCLSGVLAQSESALVHPSALVSPEAKIGVDVQIGAFSLIGPGVVLGDQVQIAPYCTITGNTVIGKGTKVWPYSSLGTRPQDLKFKGDRCKLEIGEYNLIREYCNFSIGSESGGGITKIGDGNLFMVRTHVAHDCVVGSSCIFANGVSLAGHVHVYDKAVLGGHSAVHQFVRIGNLAMIAGGAIVVQDVVPYTLVAGNHAQVGGLNSVGLKRSDLSKEAQQEIRSMYRIVFQDKNTLAEAVEKMQQEFARSSHLDLLLSFLTTTERGICR